MEDPRISRMYLAMVERAFSRTLGKFSSGAWLRSSVTWIVLLVLALVGFGVAIHERGRGHLHQLKTELGQKPAPPPALPQPGGKDPIILSRAQQAGGIAPEFLSATLLPGRGMNVFQITAYLPGKGEIPLLASPSLADAASAMTGIESDASGAQSLLMGGALEVPWAGQIFGAALPGGTAVLTNWQGRGLTVPITTLEGGANTRSSIGGLLLRRAADSSSTSPIPDGATTQATFQSGSFDGNWPSKTEVQTSVQLSAYKMEITVTARNTGTEPQPMGIGWRPRFAIPTGQRAQLRLRLPSELRTDQQDGLPTGRLLPVQGTPYDFTSPGGTALQSLSLNDTFVHLKGGSLSPGPEVELRNPAAGYGLRITAISPTIKAIHVYAPADKAIIAIDPQTNYDDPFGREWSKDEDTGLVILQPGESLQWKIQLELFTLPGQRPVGPA